MVGRMFIAKLATSSTDDVFFLNVLLGAYFNDILFKIQTTSF